MISSLENSKVKYLAKLNTSKYRKIEKKFIMILKKGKVYEEANCFLCC